MALLSYYGKYYSGGYSKGHPVILKDILLNMCMDKAILSRNNSMC